MTDETPAMESNDGTTRIGRALAVARLFFKLGVVGFGGPAAHIGMMEEEVVERRGWLRRDHFLDLVGATNLIPGPNSTEMAIHIGYIHAGVPGLLAAGAAFITPALLMTTALAWAYVRFGDLPQVAPYLVGIKPVVLAIIVGAVLHLGRTALKGWRLGLLGLAVLAAVLFGVNEVVALIAGALAGVIWFLARAQMGHWLAGLSLGSASVAMSGWSRVVQAVTEPTLIGLGLFFLRIGAVLYGSGYVLVAFLEGGLVDDLGWLTQAQLLDAISAGQFTPGPVLSTSAFVGYLIADLPGAAVAATAIFLPSFVFVLLLNPLIPRLRQTAWTAAFLDAANISAVALMLAVCLRLGAETLVNWQSWLLALAAVAGRVLWRVSPALLVIAGAMAGALLTTVFGALG